MLTQVVTVGLLASSALASQAFSPAHDFGAMLPRDVAKRQGYYPTTQYCGTGDTCKVACGSTYEQCPSESGLYCFVPSAGEHCCPDGTGNSCDSGYFCTSDGAGATYCCPDGMDLASCAASYSLTVSLIRETGTPSAYPSTGAPATSTPIHVSAPPSVPPVNYPTVSPTRAYPTGNATYTTAAPPEFTGAAAKFAGAGMAVLAGAAGIAGLL
jgi:hypothetical protein